MDIQCVFIDPVSSRVSLRLGSKLVTGAAKLFQIVVLSLLNVAGKDVLDPLLGGGAPALVGSNFDPSDSTELFAEVARVVNKAQSEIIQSQVGLSAPKEELLLSLHIVSIARGASLDAADVTVRIINEAGQLQDIVL